MTKRDVRFFWALLFWTLLPSVYYLLKMQVLSIGNANIDIMSQLEWFDLADEILVTALTTPLYFLLSDVQAKNAAQKNGLALLASFCIYGAFSIGILSHIHRIASIMQAENASQFLALQTISMIAQYISTYSIIIFSLYSDSCTINKMLVARLAMLVICDIILIPRMAENGSAISEIVVNAVVSTFFLIQMLRKKYVIFAAPNFPVIPFVKRWMSTGGYAAGQIFLDNVVYALLVVRLVNEVGESGNYWIANNFIWGWLLVPITCFSQIIKKNALDALTFKNSWKYAGYIVLLWLLTIPLWPVFLHFGMNAPAQVFSIVIKLLPFYMTYIACSFIDAWFVSKGKTQYLAIISAIVNLGYYPIVYVLSATGCFSFNMNYIIGLFGVGMAIHAVCSAILYILEKKRG